MRRPTHLVVARSRLTLNMRCDYGQQPVAPEDSAYRVPPVRPRNGAGRPHGYERVTV